MPQLFLAIDDHALPLRQQVCLTITPPHVRPEPILSPSPADSNAPDNCAAMLYGTVLQDQGKFRMWYHGCHWGRNPDWSADHQRQLVKYKDPMFLGPVCYAESEDGITWHKPALGQQPFKGSDQNNALSLPHAVTCGALVVKDESDADPARRYKMVYNYFPRYSDPPLVESGNMTSYATAVSPDGLHWTLLDMPVKNQFAEPAGYWHHQGKHIVGYQAGDGWGAHFSDGGNASARQGLSRYSLDFNHWPNAFVESFLVPEPQDPAARGHKGTYIHNHLGVAATSYGNVCLGLWGIWYNKPDFHDISCDLGLLVSHDGLKFHEPVPGHIWLKSTDSKVKDSSPPVLNTNLCQANGILNVGDETRIYHGRWRNTGFQRFEDYYSEIALATLPRDRWGSLRLFPNAKEGSVWTQPFAWPGSGITFNASGAGGLTVHLHDEAFKPLPVSPLKVKGEEGLNLPLQIDSQAQGKFKGQMVRLRVELARQGEASPALYAINIPD